jgi:hypothetical protein
MTASVHSTLEFVTEQNWVAGSSIVNSPGTVMTK